ncbi:MAG: hypothetical protein SFV32_00315 [Opitutaceae bacterium]|nr:hypothetical protein [Opitutaceae bacterium]
MKLLPVVIALATFGAVTVAAQAKNEKWKMPDGKTFSAEASEVFGPFAIFGGPGQPGRKLPLTALAEADVFRFADGLAKKPEPVADWSTSKSVMAADLKGATKVEGDKLVPVDFKGIPEPLLYVVFYADSGVGDSWGFVGGAAWRYNDFKTRFPGKVEFVMVGVRHNRTEQKKMMVDMKVPFLSIDPWELSSTFALAKAAGEPPLALLMNRDGTILGVANEQTALDAIYKEIEALLGFHRLNDPRTWKDRLYYHKLVQPRKFATGSAPPMLVGDPFDADKLREHGVAAFTAVVTVNAAGEPQSAKLKPGAKVPEDLAPQLEQVLLRAAFVPAVKNGKFIDGEYEYVF